MDLVERRAAPPHHRHPWEEARRALIRTVVAEEARRRAVRLDVALDVGSGDGWLAAGLAADLGLRRVDAFDIAYSDDDLRELGSECVHPMRDAPDARYDVVLLLDVIEHVEDDVALLTFARERLADCGFVAVSVPAWPRLATTHDRALGHYRRYAPEGLRTALAQAGLEAVVVGGAFSSLLPIRALQRMRERASGPRPLPDLGTWSHGAGVTRLVAGALTLDARLGRSLAQRGRTVPGLSLWAIAVPLS